MAGDYEEIARDVEALQGSGRRVHVDWYQTRKYESLSFYG